MKVAFHTLGCKVNQYETEALSQQFMDRGYQIVSEEDFADIYIINTCTVTGLADRKSRQYIRKMKKLSPDSIVAVTGCYAQVSPEEVEAIEGVNIVAGTNQKNKLIDYIELFLGEGKHQYHIKPYEELKTYEETGIVTAVESRTRAYIKVQEGCNRFCTYCIIPYARGAVRSRAADHIIAEARGLLAKGFKEIVLTGINTALYGMEPGYPKREDGLEGIEGIVSDLDQIEGQFRIRLSSLEPTVVNVDTVNRLLKYKKLCPHLHLSAQSGSDKILKDMNRPYTKQDYLEIVKALKHFDPAYGISTDLIVGFPGESQEDFQESLQLVREAVFCKVHVFQYSRRQATKAANMPDQIKTPIKKERSRILIEEGDTAAEEFYNRNRGQIRTVLVEELLEEQSMLTGYTDNYIRVYLNSNDVTRINTFSMVRLTEPYLNGMKGEFYE